MARNFWAPVHTTFAVCIEQIPPAQLIAELRPVEISGTAAGGQGTDFNNWIGLLPHGLNKDFNDFLVKLRVGAALELRKGVSSGAAFFVSTIARDGVVGVCDGHDARAQRNLLADKRVRVARPVEEFMMMQNHFANAGKRRQRFQNFCTENDV